jgi:hypothetical protein
MNANAERAAGERLDEAMDQGPGRFVSGTRRRLEQFEGIPVRIFDLDLTAPWTNLHLVAERHPGLLQAADARRKIDHPQHDAVPPTWCSMVAVRQRARARCSGTAQKDICIAQRNVGKRRKLLVLQCKTQTLSVTATARATSLT